MKKLALALALSALATTAVANDTNGFSGFYVGGNVGYGTASYKTAYDANTSTDIAGKGVLGGLQIGYGKQFVNNFYTGLEATGSLSGNKGSDRAGTFKADVKRTNSFGVHVRPGYVFGNTLVAAKIGIESAALKFSTRNTATPANDASSNSRKTGFVVGAGIDTKVSDHVVVGLQGTQTFYKSVSFGKTANAKTNIKTNATDVVARISYLW